MIHSVSVFLGNPMLGKGGIHLIFLLPVRRWGRGALSIKPLLRTLHFLLARACLPVPASVNVSTTTTSTLEWGASFLIPLYTCQSVHAFHVLWNMPDTINKRKEMQLISCKKYSWQNNLLKNTAEELRIFFIVESTWICKFFRRCTVCSWYVERKTADNLT